MIAFQVSVHFYKNLTEVVDEYEGQAILCDLQRGHVVGNYRDKHIYSTVSEPCNRDYCIYLTYVVKNDCRNA